MTTDPRRDRLLERLDAVAARLLASVEGLGDDELVATLPSGWTPKEMLGHLAFWAECTKPVVVGMLRGDVAAIEGWRFGSGYVPDDGQPWPIDTVHNAREAAWARAESRAAVVSRLERALELARGVVDSLDDREWSDPKFWTYVEGSVAHLEEHAREL